MKWKTQYDGDAPWISFESLRKEAERKIRKLKRENKKEMHDAFG